MTFLDADDLSEGRGANPRQSPGTLILGIALLGYVFWFRTHDISTSFDLRADQIQHWSVALRRFSDIPLAGVPSVAGGTTLGPVYYWFLWLVARLIGPFVDYLPHAGGMGIAAAQSFGDVALFFALSRRLGSIVLVVAIVLAFATSGYDATLSSTIWNPPLACAFGKLAVAALLWNRHISTRQGLAAVIASWLAVQCHMSGLAVAIPIIGLIAVAPIVRREWRTAATSIAMVTVAIGILQLPWLWYHLHFTSPGESQILSSITTTLAGRQQAIHVASSVRFVIDSLEFLLGAPYAIPFFTFVISASAIGTVLSIKEVPFLAVSIAPIACAMALYSVWQGRLDQMYWCLVLSPAGTITLLALIDRWPARIRLVASCAVLLVVLAAQPSRARMAWTFHRLPSYGALVKGCRTILAEGRPVREIRLTFPVPADTDPLWLYSVMGGSLRGGPSAYLATIDGSGAVRYK